MLGVKYKNLNSVCLLFKAYGIDISDNDKDNNNALHYLIKYYNEPIFNLVMQTKKLENKIKSLLMTKNNQGKTPYDINPKIFT